MSDNLNYTLFEDKKYGIQNFGYFGDMRYNNQIPTLVKYLEYSILLTLFIKLIVKAQYLKEMKRNYSTVQ